VTTDRSRAVAGNAGRAGPRARGCPACEAPARAGRRSVAVHQREILTVERAAQQRPHRRHAGGLFGAGGQIGPLQRVGHHVEELEAVAGGVPDQLVAAVADHPRGLGAGVAFAVDPFARRLGQHRAPLDRLRAVDARKVEQRRHDVLQPHEPVADRIRRDPARGFGVDDQQRHPRRAVKHQPFRVDPEIAQHLAMIGGEDDDRVIEDAFLAQAADHQPQLVVDLGDERVIGPAHVGHLLGRDRGEAVLHGAQQPRRVLLPLRRKRLGHGATGVAGDVAAERRQRRVWMGEGEIPEPRPRGIAAADLPRRHPRGPVGDVQRVRQVPRRPAVFVVAHAVQELRPGMARVGQRDFVIVGPAEMRAPFLGAQHVVETDAVAHRVDVQLAGGEGLVAGAAEGVGQRRHALRHGQGGLEVAVAVAARRPREQRVRAEGQARRAD